MWFLYHWLCLVSPDPKILCFTLEKHSDNIQPCHSPFLILNQSIVPSPVLTVASGPANRFLRRQVGYSGIPISLRIFHSLLWSTQRLLHIQQNRNRWFSATALLFPWSSEYWQFDLMFFSLWNPACTYGSSWFTYAEAQLEGFWAYSC